MFYDRFALANTLTAERYNGVVEQQYVVTNPPFLSEHSFDFVADRIPIDPGHSGKRLECCGRPT